MNYIVLDMEWNQPFTFERMIKEPVMLYGEIVQIGAVKLDENYHIVDTFKIMVAPKYYRKMHKTVSRLTGITTEELQYGFPLAVALKHFRKWCGEEFLFLTWGANDIDMLRDNMKLYELDSDWIPNTYNLQLIFDDQITKENRQVSLTYAMEKICESALEAHDALHDAKNAARICLHMDMNKGLGAYDELHKRMEERPKTVIRHDRAVRLYETREAALTDEAVIRFHCPVCGAEVVCDEPVKQNADKYMCIAKCDKGDETFVRFRIRKAADSKFRISRILYELNEELKTFYQMKKQSNEERRQRFIEAERMRALQEGECVI